LDLFVVFWFRVFWLNLNCGLLVSEVDEIQLHVVDEALLGFLTQHDEEKLLKVQDRLHCHEGGDAIEVGFKRDQD
jgi:hypothetical protein